MKGIWDFRWKGEGASLEKFSVDLFDLFLMNYTICL
jgi:hypothetical protein